MSEHLAGRLRIGTRALHATAERSGIMKTLLGGRIRRGAYCLLLRNLAVLYDALERALDHHAASPFVAPVRMPELFRTAALHEDLLTLAGQGWTRLPVTGSMASYVSRITEISGERPWLLAAHAYVRYMGDLSGGQLLRDIVRDSLGLEGEEGTAFYRFGTAERVDALKRRFREGLNQLPADGGEDAMVAEANAAFALHVLMFEELEGPRAGGGKPRRGGRS